MTGDPDIEAAFTTEEYAAWIAGDMISYDPDSMRRVYSVDVDVTGVRLRVSKDDFDVLIHAVAADLNHETRRVRVALMNSLYEKLLDALAPTGRSQYGF